MLRVVELPNDPSRYSVLMESEIPAGQPEGGRSKVGAGVLVAGAIALLLGVGGSFVVNRLLTHTSMETQTKVTASGLPVVMRSNGGLLEISTVTVHERFTRTDTKAFWGIPLGTTVSIIQVPATYRYHIEMAKEWPIQIETRADGSRVATVHAAEVKPSLPVAIDTAKMEKYSQSGWARFNKDENLSTLEQSVTPELQKRANLSAVRQLAMDAGRQTVREFVTTWLLKEQAWKRDPAYQVNVLFPGESGAPILAMPNL